MEKINPQVLKKYAERTASEEDCEKVEKWLDEEDNLFEDMAEGQSAPERDAGEGLSVLWRSFVRRTDLGLRYLRIWWFGTRIAIPVLAIAAGAALYVYRADPLHRDASGNLLVFEVPRGKRMSVRLSDGTLAHLSGGSKLICPKIFQGPERSVSLEYGRALLVVSENPDRPFFLQSGGVQVEVLGTVFEVSNPNGGETIAVVLKEGVVEFSDPSGFSRTMKPGDKLVYSKNGAPLTVFGGMDVSTVGLWAQGLLQFKLAQMEDVLAVLEDHFSVAFRFEGEDMRTVPVTGKFDGMPLDRILFLLGESTGLSFENQDGFVLVKR